jgi:hypothetical protein
MLLVDKIRERERGTEGMPPMPYPQIASAAEHHQTIAKYKGEASMSKQQQEEMLPRLEEVEEMLPPVYTTAGAILPAEELARLVCIDCGINIVEIGEFYMCDSDIWERLGLGWTDNLCLGCLDKRLGRKARFWHELFPVSYPWMRPLSDRMKERLDDAMRRDKSKTL